MEAIEAARASRRGDDRLIVIFQTIYTRRGSVNRALEALRMARKLDRYRHTARMALEPWVVEIALGRLDERRLTSKEQAIIVGATRTTWKVRWPDWWNARGSEA
jgi:hypothetical protein